VVRENGREGAEWIDAALVEYEAHRAEVLAEAQGQQQTLALGATAVGILFAGAFNVWDDRVLAVAAFLGAIPLLCILVLIQWAGRASGIMLVGVYLEGLECALREAYASPPAPVLTWERSLVNMRPSRWRPRYAWHEFGAVAVFAMLAAGSIALGAYRGYEQYTTLVVALVTLQVVIVSFFTAVLAWSLATVRKRARREFPRAGSFSSQSPTT
jgi:hypothetical protein